MVGWPEPVACQLGAYYIDMDPTNTYLAAAIGDPQGVILDETTQVASPTWWLDFDDATSLTFIQVLAAVRILPDGEEGGFCYASITWSPAQALGAVQLDLIFYADAFTEITRFTADNTGGSTTTLSVLVDTEVSVPAGGLIRAEVTRLSGSGTMTYGGNIELNPTDCDPPAE